MLVYTHHNICFIGHIILLLFVFQGLDRVVFVGNFLRVNVVAMKLLSSAMDYWSQGAMKALFLEHEVGIWYNFIVHFTLLVY